jgi:drug/metabolite transporter (DMT)-like permease
MTPEEDERVESVDLEDGSALLSRDGPTAASDAGVRLPAFGGDVAFLERSAFGAPLWAWAQLAAAVLAISTAGIAFDQLPEVPPLRLASWRMQATSLVLLVGAQREWRAADACTKNFALRRDTLVLLVVSGTCLGVHFGLWVAGLQSTSLSHSLLLVTCTPLFLAFGAFALGFPTSRGELLGAALGVAGVALVAFDTRRASNLERVTWQGDVLSLGAAVAIIGYMHIGAELRQTMPLFLYAFPVTATSAAFLSFAAVVVGEPTSSEAWLLDVFGWALASPPSRLLRRFAVVAYLALGPGLIGHTGYNAVLRHVTPLVVSTALTLEPALGSALGYFLGVADAPGAQTLLGGAAVVCAVATVIAASARRHEDAGRRSAS